LQALSDDEVSAELSLWLNKLSDKSQDWRDEAMEHIARMPAFSRRYFLDTSEMERRSRLERLMEQASGESTSEVAK
jgi:hypothetical protein